MTNAETPLSRRQLAALWLFVVVLYAYVLRSFFQVSEGVGIDYSYFFPRLLEGAWWRKENGFFAVQWFSPSFCGGIPRIPDGQDLSYSVPQWLAYVVNPLEASYLTELLFAVLGGVGFGLLLVRAFGASTEVGVLGAVLLLCNSAHEARALAGHLAYHGMMLVPWAALGALLPRSQDPRVRKRELLERVLLLTLSMSYLAWCGLLNVLVPLSLAIAATVLVHVLLRGSALREASLRLLLAGLFTLALGAAKLAAFSAYFSHFRRDFYELPGIDSFVVLLRTLFSAVFGAWAAPSVSISIDPPWTVESQELAYGVGPLPLFGLLCAAVFGWQRRTTFTWTKLRAFCLLGLVFLCVLPLAINYYTPGWNAFLKKLPVLSSSSNLFRWWLFYVFVVPLGVLGFECFSTRARTFAVVGGVLLTATLLVTKERPCALAHAYNAEPVLRAWSAGQNVPVRSVSRFKVLTVQRNSALVEGQSQLFCYEPAFGYRLERFRVRTLHDGPITDETNGFLNLKNPACYVWPRENQCRVGEHFRVHQRDDLLRFAARRPYAFAVSRTQRFANAVTLLSLAGVFASLLFVLRSRLRSAPDSEHGLSNAKTED